jgi:hypothetical protein
LIIGSQKEIMSHKESIGAEERVGEERREEMRRVKKKTKHVLLIQEEYECQDPRHKTII